MMHAARPIYLDYASTTPVHPAVLQAMEPYLRQEFGNPSNLYRVSRRAADALEGSRATVARVLGCHDDEVVFTSGGSEADNLALKGVALALRDKRHLVTTTIEHSAVLGAARDLQQHFGVEVTYVPIDASGIVDPAAVAAVIRPDTCLVSVMLANNEIGTIQPVAEIARLARARGALVHTDAVQAAGFLDLDVDRLGVDALSLSAHKFYAPKGVGVLYLRRGTPLLPLIHGGSQERGRRAGTENVAGIVGCGVALELVERHRGATAARLTALRDRLIAGLEAAVPGALLNGDPRRRAGPHRPASDPRRAHDGGRGGARARGAAGRGAAAARDGGRSLGAHDSRTPPSRPWCGGGAWAGPPPPPPPGPPRGFRGGLGCLLSCRGGRGAAGDRAKDGPRHHPRPARVIVVE